VGFADSFVLNNQALNFTKKSRITIQWATSAKETEENNNKVKQGKKLNPKSLQDLTQVGRVNLAIPKNAEYFRVLAWSKSINGPDFLTNWVDIIPNKIYRLDDDYFIPLALIAGMGC